MVEQKNVGVIYWIQFKWLTVVIAVIHSAGDTSGGEKLGQPQADTGGGMPDFGRWTVEQCRCYKTNFK